MASLTKPTVNTLDKRIVRLDFMPDLKVGKVDARVNATALAAMLADAESGEDDFRWPRDATERCT